MRSSSVVAGRRRRPLSNGLSLSRDGPAPAPRRRTSTRISSRAARHAAPRRVDPDVVGWVAADRAARRRVASVCTGAFAAGARGAARRPPRDDALGLVRRAGAGVPGVDVDADPIFVRDGDVWTSAGVTAGMDLALALVEEDLGREIALETARWLVLFLKRPGGQSQFSAGLAARSAGARAAARPAGVDGRQPRRATCRWPRWPSGRACRERHFARAFRRETGHDAGGLRRGAARRARAGAAGGRRRGWRPSARAVGLRQRRDPAPRLPPPAGRRPGRLPRALPRPRPSTANQER